MPLIALINPEHVSDDEAAVFRRREAARAVVFDAEGRIALLHVAKKNYYKLPGGGLEGDEDRHLALRRECLEEIGCAIEIQGEVGMTVEYRKIFSLHQTSYVYRASVVGKKGSPEFTPEEAAEGFEVVWLPISDALTALRSSRATDAEGREYIVPRDIAVLETASKGLL